MDFRSFLGQQQQAPQAPTGNTFVIPPPGAPAPGLAPRPAMPQVPPILTPPAQAPAPPSGFAQFLAANAAPQPAPQAPPMVAPGGDYAAGFEAVKRMLGR